MRQCASMRSNTRTPRRNTQKRAPVRRSIIKKPTCVTSRKQSFSSAAETPTSTIDTAAGPTVTPIVHKPWTPTHASLQPTVQPFRVPTAFDTVVPRRLQGTQPRQMVFDLMKWVVSNGGKVNPNVFYGTMNMLRDKNCQDTGYWRGLALNDIAAGEVIAEIPLDCCLFPLEQQNVANVQEEQHIDPVLAGLSSLLQTIPGDKLYGPLALRLLSEIATESSHFKPYLDVLPAQFPTIPLFFSQHAGRALSYRPMQLQLNATVQNLSKLASHLTLPENVLDMQLETLPQRIQHRIQALGTTPLSLGDLAWSHSAVSSRALRVPFSLSRLTTETIDAIVSAAATQDEHSSNVIRNSFNRCFIPLVDMLNHNFAANTKIVWSLPDNFDPNDQILRSQVRCKIVSTKAITSGQELTLNYVDPTHELFATRSPVHVAELNADTQDSLAEQIKNADSIPDLFALSLVRLPIRTAEGLAGPVGNDIFLKDYGFIPPWNIADDVQLNPELSYFDTALEMSHDITISHSYLAGKLANSPGNQTNQQLKEQSTLPGDNIAVQSIDEQMKAMQKQAAMFGQDNSYDSAMVKIVLPSTQQRTDEQSLLLNEILQTKPLLAVTYQGPNRELLGICRLLAAGAHQGDQKAAYQATDKNNNDNVENEIIAQQLSEARVQGQILHVAQEVFDIALQRADDVTEIEKSIGMASSYNGPYIFKGFMAGPLSPANEQAAMAILYHSLVISTGSFDKGIVQDTQEFYQSLMQQKPGDATAYLFSRSKKMVVAHNLKVLATGLGLDSEDNKIHKWHTKLDDSA